MKCVPISLYIQISQIRTFKEYFSKFSRRFTWNNYPTPPLHLIPANEETYTLIQKVYRIYAIVSLKRYIVLQKYCVGKANTSKETWFRNVIWEPFSETDAQRYVKASKSALRDVYVENKGKKHTHIGRKRENSTSKLPKRPDLHPQTRHKTNTYSYYS